MQRTQLQMLTRAARDGWNRRLPPRYLYPEQEGPAGFRRRVASALGEGATVLDVGAGSRPAIAPQDRPPGCVYVGLDRSREQLLKAPSGSFDEIVVGDATIADPALEGRFDLAVSWFVLEHLRPLEAALRNVRSYLKPGGRFVAYLAGRYGAASTVNRIVPRSLATRLLQRTDRAAEDSFPAYYDRCTYSGLVSLSSDWGEFAVVPSFTGSRYFRFSRALHAAYLAYEELIFEHDRKQLASYYLLDAAAPSHVH